MQVETPNKHLAIVRLDRTFDFRNAAEFKEVCQKKIEADIHHFILDFSETTLLDSTALGAIFSVYRQVSEKDGQVALANISGAVKTVVGLTKIFKVFPVYNTVDAALEALS